MGAFHKGFTPGVNVYAWRKLGFTAENRFIKFTRAPVMCVKYGRSTPCRKFYEFNMSVYTNVNEMKIQANTGLTCPE